MFPKRSLPEFLLPRLWIAPQRRKVRVSGVQESFTAIKLNRCIEHRLHGLLLLMGNLPEQCMGTRAKANVGSAGRGLHNQRIALVCRSVYGYVRCFVLVRIATSVLVDPAPLAALARIRSACAITVADRTPVALW